MLENVNKFLQSLKRLQQASKGWNDCFNNQHYHIKLISKLYAKYGFELKLTCGACPEQYEVFRNGIQVAYFRLRHGYFRVDSPDCRGLTIYEALPAGDGIFEDYERLNYLKKSLDALNNYLNKTLK